MARAVVLLSIGGQLFTTTAATLTSPLAAGSMLERLLDLHQQAPQDSADAADSMQPTLADPRHPDELFIDRDGTHFSHILGYLRDGDVVLHPDLQATKLLLKEAQYYQLTGLIAKLQQHESIMLIEAQQARREAQQAREEAQQAKQEAQQAKQHRADALIHTANHNAEMLRYLKRIDNLLIEEAQPALTSVKFRLGDVLELMRQMKDLME